MAGNKNTLKRKQKAENQKTLAWKHQFMQWFEDSDIDPGVLEAAYEHYIQIGAFTMEYEFRDNFRVADSAIPAQTEEYYKRKGSGCCGYYDTIIEADGKSIMVGFNYGH